MTITPLDRLTYLVTSGGNTYFVDMEENDGFGRCDCGHFRCKVQPLLDKRIKVEPCKHIAFLRNKPPI